MSKPSHLPRLSRLIDDPWLAPHLEKIAERANQTTQLEKSLIADHPSLWDWAQGHRWFGLHQQPDGSWIYRDWAPNATSLALIGHFNERAPTDAYKATAIGNGEWELKLPAEALSHGQRYRVYLTWPGGEGERLPAWGNRMWQCPASLLFFAEVWAPKVGYTWQHEAPAPSPFTKIYEAHPGIATEELKVGSWREFAETVVPTIAKAGYDTIQLMAVMEHPYYGSFGYHVGSFFAASSRFGTPDDLKYLVDTAHGLGLRVIMDLVHSHAVKNEIEGLSKYDGTAWQFFHDGPRGQHSAWDSRCFDYAKPQVLHFLCSNLRYWLEEYGFDGFRFDGVTSMLYRDHGLGKPFSSYDDYFGDNIDEAALAYLCLANRLIHQARPSALTIAEDVSGMPGLGAPLEDNGLGFDYRLAMGLPDRWFKLAKDTRDEDWSMNALWHELTNHRSDEHAISYVESHDQALVGGKSFIFQLIDADMYDAMHLGSANMRVDRGVALHKMARLATAASAGAGYLNFMGNEFGHPEWIDFPRAGNDWSYAKARRQWSLRHDSSLRFKGLADFDQAIMGLIEPNWLHVKPWLVKADDGDKILAFMRGSRLYVFNFHPEKSYEGYGLQVPAGTYQLLLDTDQAAYGGFDRLLANQSADTTSLGDSQWLRLYLPSRSAVVWEKGGDSAA